ncbi:MAG: putative sugar O-methyltransferase [Solirubrobacteraceae bacterium]|nr:putative sugar O-methyltransferase [Solirubrobacteraceae bacterium]
MTDTMDQTGLRAMVEDMRTADRLYWPSPFWETLIEEQTVALEQQGIEHFKRTLNMQYFSWSLRWILVFLMWPVLRRGIRQVDRQLLTADADVHRPASGLRGRLENRLYGIYIALLNRVVGSDDPLGLLSTLDEPSLGDPIIVRDQGRLRSQDLPNSVHELYAALEDRGTADAPIHVMELGAGYGRVGYAFLKALPSCTYTVVDIPPTLHVAQTYLPQLFPEEQIFRFRPFSSYDEIKEEFEAAKIRFVAAHQISMLPDASVDLFLNISSLHEMTLEQITHYLEQADRLTTGHMYTKQWLKSRAPGNEFRISEHEYPLPASWTTVYHRRHPLQPRFFHALYRVPATS